MPFHDPRQFFNTLPLYVRVLIVAIMVSLLLILLAKREIVSNALQLLRALPPVVILPKGHRLSPTEDEA